MTNQFVNAAADSWAKRNLVKEFEIKPLHSSAASLIMVGLGTGFLALVFLGIPGLLFYSAGVRYAARGWSSEVSRAVVLGSIFLVSFMAFTAFVLFYLWKVRRNQVTLLTSEGIRTRSGKHYEWKHLQNMTFVRVETEVRGGFLLRFTTRALYAGAQKIKVEMFFFNARVPAIIPPLIANQREILELLKTVPVERRAHG